jgi:cysteine synthase/rhodanese-related sulfurtransferase
VVAFAEPNGTAKFAGPKDSRRFPTEFMQAGLEALRPVDATRLLERCFGVALESKGIGVYIVSFSGLPHYGTAKSLTAYSMVADALAKGTLKAGCIVVEPTSGNTGLALADILRSVNVSFVMVVSRKISVAFEEELRSRFGAAVIEVDDPSSTEPVFEFVSKHGGSTFTLLVKLPVNYCPTEEPTGAIAYAKKLVDESRGGIMMLDQYNNDANPEVHRLITARSIFGGAPASDGRPLYVFLSGGTFGTALGLARHIVDAKVDAKLVVALPRGEDVFGVVDHDNAKRRRFYKELVELASKSGRQLFEVVDVDSPSEKIAKMWAVNRMLKSFDGNIDLTGGYSSMLVIWCALDYVERRSLRDAVCVLLFHDSAQRYPEPVARLRGTQVEAGDLIIDFEEAKKLVASGDAHIVYVDPIPAPMPMDAKLKLKDELESMFGAKLGDQDIYNIEDAISLDGTMDLVDAGLKPQFFERVVRLASGTTVIFVCPHGGTSRIVASKARSLGVNRAYSLKGGLDSLRDPKQE